MCIDVDENFYISSHDRSFLANTLYVLLSEQMLAQAIKHSEISHWMLCSMQDKLHR